MSITTLSELIWPRSYPSTVEHLTCEVCNIGLMADDEGDVDPMFVAPAQSNSHLRFIHARCRDRFDVHVANCVRLPVLPERRNLKFSLNSMLYSIASYYHYFNSFTICPTVVLHDYVGASFVMHIAGEALIEFNAFQPIELELLLSAITEVTLEVAADANLKAIHDSIGMHLDRSKATDPTHRENDLRVTISLRRTGFNEVTKRYGYRAVITTNCLSDTVQKQYAIYRDSCPALSFSALKEKITVYRNYRMEEITSLVDVLRQAPGVKIMEQHATFYASDLVTTAQDPTLMKYLYNARVTPKNTPILLLKDAYQFNWYTAPEKEVLPVYTEKDKVFEEMKWRWKHQFVVREEFLLVGPNQTLF